MMRNFRTKFFECLEFSHSFWRGSAEENLENKRLPDAIIYGVRKGGTRALLEFLRIHPKAPILSHINLFGSLLRTSFDHLKNRVSTYVKYIYLLFSYYFHCISYNISFSLNRSIRFLPLIGRFTFSIAMILFKMETGHGTGNKWRLVPMTKFQSKKLRDILLFAKLSDEWRLNNLYIYIISY